MSPDFASRLRARFSRRRHSATPSLASSRSDVDSVVPSLVGSQQQQQRESSSLYAASQPRLDHFGSDVVFEKDAAHHHHDDVKRDLLLCSHKDSSISRSWVVTKADSGDDGASATETQLEPTPSPEPATTVVAVAAPTKDGPPEDAVVLAVTAPEDAPASQSPTGAANLSPGSTTAAAAPAQISGSPGDRQNLTKDHLGSDLHPQPSLSPPSQPPNLHSIREDPVSSPTSTSNTDAPDHDDTSRVEAIAEDDGDDEEAADEDDDDPEQLALSTAAQTPATSADAVADPLASGLLFHHPQPHRPDHHHTQAGWANQSYTRGPATPSYLASPSRPAAPPRVQSLISNRHSALIKNLLQTPQPTYEHGGLAGEPPPPLNALMGTRKIWVRRPGASATIISVSEDDLVDDVRDMILRKYANSLGRTFDAPDLTMRICPRDHSKDRLLGPEEPVGRILDAYYPGGQTVDEALVIDIPRRTPKASPRAPLPPHTAAAAMYYADDGRPSEAGEGYFPPVGAAPSSPRLPLAVPAPTNGTASHSIAVLGTGHIPAIPSPGETRPRPYRGPIERPHIVRTHTASPTSVSNVSSAAVSSGAAMNHPHFKTRGQHTRGRSESSQPGTIPMPIPMATSPGPDPSQVRVSTPPPPRVSSPRPSSSRPKKKKHVEQSVLGNGMLNGTVPPINVLIVEDNPINLKLLEAFVKRLKVRWNTAMNGKDAVKMWRTGGFHLVLMDIQLPVMNGLEATREIRRLERVNSIGVFSSPSSPQEETNGEVAAQDRLEKATLFKSPVIIVALTASSLQSDRHEALAAGCNDFLTKVCNTNYHGTDGSRETNNCFSRSILCGLSERSWNGDVCRR